MTNTHPPELDPPRSDYDIGTRQPLPLHCDKAAWRSIEIETGASIILRSDNLIQFHQMRQPDCHKCYCTSILPTSNPVGQKHQVGTVKRASGSSQLSTEDSRDGDTPKGGGKDKRQERLGCGSNDNATALRRNAGLRQHAYQHG